LLASAHVNKVRRERRDVNRIGAADLARKLLINGGHSNVPKMVVHAVLRGPFQHLVTARQGR
jgi:hypothetical protein